MNGKDIISRDISSLNFNFRCICNIVIDMNKRVNDILYNNIVDKYSNYHIDFKCECNKEYSLNIVWYGIYIYDHPNGNILKKIELFEW